MKEALLMQTDKDAAGNITLLSRCWPKAKAIKLNDGHEPMYLTVQRDSMFFQRKCSFQHIYQLPSRYMLLSLSSLAISAILCPYSLSAATMNVAL
jgi:hypothetical protein